MTHNEVEHNEIIERYVRNRLSPEERSAFEEHLFRCDQCFEELQLSERFVAGIRDASETGQLGPEWKAPSTVNRWPAWVDAFTPVAAVATVVLAVTIGWLLWVQIPQLRRELAHERDARQKAEQQSSDLQARLAALPPVQPAGPEANIALVMLDASRASETGATLALSPADSSFVLWIDVGPESSRSFQMKIYGQGDQVVQTIDGLKKNSYGALAVSLPARTFAPGAYIVKLFAADGPRPQLRGEYRLHIRGK